MSDRNGGRKVGAPDYSGRDAVFSLEIKARFANQFTAEAIKLNDPRMSDEERRLRRVLLVQAEGGGPDGRIARWRLGIGPQCV